jgi:hypothetical protein
MFSAEVEFKGKQAGGRIYRPCFRENKPKTLVFNDLKRAFWAFFPENCVYKFGHGKNLVFTRTFLWMLSEKKRSGSKFSEITVFLKTILPGWVIWKLVGIVHAILLLDCQLVTTSTGHIGGANTSADFNP